MKNPRYQSGFSVVELGVVLTIGAVVAAIAIPSMLRWIDTHKLTQAARVVDSAFSFARSEAIRTGNVHIVFAQTDAQNNPLQDAGGDPLHLVVIDDGRVGSANQNCLIDAGERVLELRLEDGVSFGVTSATAPAPGDAGGAIVNGSSFRDAGGNAALWVQFQAEGPARAFSSDCTTGGIGTGGGGRYLTNDSHDVAILVTPLGGTRMHRWATDAWSS